MTTPNLPSDQSLTGRKKTPEEIEAEISQTRSAITEDIKALGEKLSPENLKQGAKDVLHEAKEEATEMLRTAKDHAIESVTETISEIGDRARHAGHVIGDRARLASHVTTDFVSANAVPLTLIAIGAGWLVLTMRHQRNGGSNRYLQSNLRSDRYYRSGWQEQADDFMDEGEFYEGRSGQFSEGRGQHSGGQHSEGLGHQIADRTHQLADRAREGASELRDRASEKLGAVRSRVRETASDLGHRASDMTHEARERLDAAGQYTRDFARDNPVAVGALAVAAGIGVGMMLPMTRPENRLMGPARDRLLGEARHTAQRVGRTAREAVGDLREAIAEPSPR